MSGQDQGVAADAAALPGFAPSRDASRPSAAAANATEAEAEVAISQLERAINAARNSNQAGENAVVRAAASLSGDGACRNCNETEWVCENHPDRPWDKSAVGCECGAGMPCGACNLEMASAGYVDRARKRIVAWLRAQPASYSGWNDHDELWDAGYNRAVELIANDIERRADASVDERPQGQDPQGLGSDRTASAVPCADTADAPTGGVS